MSRSAAPRKYGKKPTRTKAERLFADLPQSPVRTADVETVDDGLVQSVTGKLANISIVDDEKPRRKPPRKGRQGQKDVAAEDSYREQLNVQADNARGEHKPSTNSKPTITEDTSKEAREKEPKPNKPEDDSLRILTWEDLCAPTDKVVKIAEASYAEVYRVTNDRGTSIIKVIRLDSPIKPKTKAQVRAGLVDEEPHSEADVQGELQISEWLADIPGFVVYKERYIVQGKATRQLLETHQIFQRRMKRQDPGRAQFYPSPSRYLDDTKFLVVELGDAGVALEDWELKYESHLWDIFILEAIALARAEDLAMFEHRDLHEGNLCIKRVCSEKERPADSTEYFGYSGLDITILDYGLSRAEDLSIDFAKPVAFDLERDLSIFISNHAPQCKVYRQMRSFLLRADRKCLPPEAHCTPYAQGIDGPLSWEAFAPYTNVLWLAYLYEYLVQNFAGNKKELAHFRKETSEMWNYLNPDAKDDVPCFGSAADIVRFAVEAGWVRQDQLTEGESILGREDREDSIRLSRDDGDGDGDSMLRRSPRRRQTGGD